MNKNVQDIVKAMNIIIKNRVARESVVVNNLLGVRCYKKLLQTKTQEFAMYCCYSLSIAV